MKSLEIANKIQNDFNECFSKYDVATMTIIKPNFYAKEWEQIKKDLEVLEILKKYLYIVENQIPRTDDYFEILESDLDEMQDDENCDDFHKVKQWLEAQDEKESV